MLGAEAGRGRGGGGRDCHSIPDIQGKRHPTWASPGPGPLGNVLTGIPEPCPPQNRSFLIDTDQPGRGEPFPDSEILKFVFWLFGVFFSSHK